MAKNRNSRYRPVNAKLNMQTARKIRTLHTKGTGVCALARQFNVHHSTIQAVIQNRTWR